MTAGLALAVAMAVGYLQLSAADAWASPTPSAPATQPAEAEGSAGPLAKKLAQMKSQFEARTPESVKKVYAQGIEEVAQSGVMERALKAGDMAPMFTLQDSQGQDVSLSGMLERGPVVIIWLRGGWCPYCTVQYSAFAQEMDAFKQAGATVVAITPELVDHSLAKQMGEAGAPMPVLADVGLKVADQFKIAYTLPAGVQQSFKGRLDLAKFNGDDSMRLPLSATYVIGKDGKVAHVWMDADYRARAEPADVLKALAKL